MYKENIKKIDDFDTVLDVIDHYGRSGKLFTYKVFDNYFELVFNRNRDSAINLLKYSDFAYKYAPVFYLDDDNIFLDINQITKLVLIDRFEYFNNDPAKVKFVYLFRSEAAILNSFYTYIEPFSYNNKVKTKSRIRVVRTYTETQEGKKYHNPFGNSLWYSTIPNGEEDIKKYARLFNDPINVVKPAEGVYCKLSQDEYYRGVGLSMNKESITSIFKPKSNLPERLRQHYTSNYLEPKEADTDYLMDKDYPKEKMQAVCVFVPISSKFESPFGDRPHPTGENSLISGELLISEDMAKRQVFLRRTATTTSKHVTTVDEGTVVNYGDVLAYNFDGTPDIFYDLKYENAVVETIKESYAGYKIILKIQSDLGVARVISDYGLKGVTHPRKKLGVIELPKEIGGETDDVLMVDMVVGPNSMKSGSNGIRLAWLALKNAIEGKHININADNISEDDITQMTSDIKKVNWRVGGNTYEVYAGLVSFGVTDLARDCRSDNVRVMPETLKYMYMSGDESLKIIADTLISDYIADEDKWLLKEFMSIRDAAPNADDLIWDIDDPEFKKYLASSYFNVNTWQVSKKFLPVLLNNPFNGGLYIKIRDRYIKMPSARLISYQTQVINNSIVYPEYLNSANLILLSIKLYHQKKADLKSIYSNIAKYMSIINNYIFEKRGILSMACSPIVTGGNLKQIVSPYVPRGVTVIVDKYLEKKIRSFGKNFSGSIYEIGVRNPVLWDFQLAPKKVWTFAKFEKHLMRKGISIDDVILLDRSVGSVMRNSVDVMYDQSDTDGDLYPVCIPLNKKIQNNINKYVRKKEPIAEYKEKWVNDYMKNECDNDKFMEVENKPFKYYTVSRKWFGETFARSASAKNMIGVATVNLWKFQTCAESMKILGYITPEQFDYMIFTYSKIVQDYVIRGIKHVDAGASNYAIYCSLTSENIEEGLLVKHDLMKHHGFSEEEAHLFLKIMAGTQEDNFVKLFSRLPNGGVSDQLNNLFNKVDEIDVVLYRNLSYAKILHPYTDLLFANKMFIDSELATISITN